jgi:tetratricopeptide (TPR) repeat protein
VPEEDDAVATGSSLHIRRARRFSDAPVGAADFGAQLAALIAPFESAPTAEMLTTELRLEPGDAVAHTRVRFDLVGRRRDGSTTEAVGEWRIDWQRGGAGAWLATAWQPEALTRSSAAQALFVEATASAFGRNPGFGAQFGPGIDHWRRVVDGTLVPEVMGHHGVAVADVDGDGLDDLYVAEPSGLPNRLFHNNGDGTFVDVSEQAGVAALDSTSAPLLIDVDNDGNADLVLVTPGTLLLFMGDGKGHFTFRPDAFHFKKAPQGDLIGAVAADFDRDGFLDLYVCAYSYFTAPPSPDGSGAYLVPTPYHDARNGPPNILFRNDGHGRFEDVTEETGLGANNDRFSFTAAWGDYDGDGWPDLYVANDFGRNNLYHNNGLKDGRVTFTDVAETAGVSDVAAGMSAAWLDYDGDGRPDLYVGNMWSAPGQRLAALPQFQAGAPEEVRAQYARHARGNSLYRNRGDGSFEDVSAASGTTMGRWAWSSDAIDVDGDGWEDLYVANGFVTGSDTRDLLSFFWRQVISRSPLGSTPTPEYEDGWRTMNALLRASGSESAHERNVFLRNAGDGRFDDLSGVSGLDLDQDGRAFAVADFDGDGAPDLVVRSRTGPRLRYFRNEVPPAGDRLAMRLVGTRSNRDAVGAEVTVETTGRRYVKTVTAGSGFLSQHSKELLFGLGRGQAVRRIVIKWPSGALQELGPVAVNQRIRVREGEDGIEASAFRPPQPHVSAAPLVDVAPPPDHGTWFYDQYQAPDFALPDRDGAVHRLSSERGHPVVLSVWGGGCAECDEQAGILRSSLARLQAAGAAVLALSEGAALPAGVPVLRADDLTLAAYDVFARHLFDLREDLPLPSTFLLDRNGRVAKLYRRAVAADALLADLREIEASDGDAVLARALPFPGRYFGPLPRRNDVQLGMELMDRGLDDAAAEAFARALEGSPTPALHHLLGTLHVRRGRRAEARAAFARALALQPSHPEANNSMGALLAEEGDLERAIPYFQAALAAKPNDADALNNLGYALVQSGRADGQAEQLLRRAIELRPDFAEAYNSLGIFHGRQGDLTRAETYFKQAVDKRPGYGEAVNNLAMVYGATGRDAEAVALLESFLQQDPEFEMTYVVLARIHLQHGRRAEAVASLRRLLARNPSHALAKQMLGEIGG